MAIKSKCITHLNPSYTYAYVDFMFELKEWLVDDMGWTVQGSSNGTAAGHDAVDRWTTKADASASGSWIVLESPHTLAADRVHILLDKRLNAAAAQASYGYDPEANYTGGTTSALPTSATALPVSYCQAGVSSLTGYNTLIFTGDNTNHSFFASIHDVGTFTTRSFFGLIYMNGQPSAGSPGKAYYAFGSWYNASANPAGLCDYITTPLNIPSGCAQHQAGEAAAATSMMQLKTYNNIDAAPDQDFIDADGNETAFPIPIGNQESNPGHFYGTLDSNFASWGSYSRHGYLMSGKTRLRVNSLLLAWDSTVAFSP